MIRAVVRTGDSIVIRDKADPRSLWIDLCAPTDEERAAAEMAAGVTLPARVRMRVMEPSRAFVSLPGQVDLAFSTVAESPVAPVELITCVITPNCLVTLRAGGDEAIADTLKAVRAHPDFAPHDVMISLCEASVDAASDRLGILVGQVDSLTAAIFETKHQKNRRPAAPDLRRLMRRLGSLGTAIMRVEDSLASLKHVAAFLERHQARIAPHAEDSLAIAAFRVDVDGLTVRAQALNEKVDFLLNAMLGVIGHDQNRITMALSLIAALFLPATLIASIFGMNFVDMPGLKWHHGFFLCIGVMAVAAGSMAAWFHWRRWI